MSEPYLPIPPPEEDGYRDPEPAICPECRTRLQATEPLKEGGEKGICEVHGWVLATYPEDRR